MHTHMHTRKLKRSEEWFSHLEIMSVQEESYWQNNTLKTLSLFISLEEICYYKRDSTKTQTERGLFQVLCEFPAPVLAKEK